MRYPRYPSFPRFSSFLVATWLLYGIILLIIINCLGIIGKLHGATYAETGLRSQPLPVFVW